MNGPDPFVNNTMLSYIPWAVRYGKPFNPPCPTLHIRKLTTLDPFSLFFPFHRSPSDPRTPQGLSYHLIEIWLPELEKASQDSTAQKSMPLKLLLAPLLALAAKTPNKVTYQQVQANLLEPLLSALSSPQNPEGSLIPAARADDEFPHLLANATLSQSDEPPVDKNMLRQGLLKYIFEVASREDSKDSNRKRLYAICSANIDEDDDI